MWKRVPLTKLRLLKLLRMSKFDFSELTEGRFELVGEMSFGTASEILKISEPLFNQHQVLEIDLSNVERADSAGLALLLEWKAQANQRGHEIAFLGIPDSLLAIAQTTEVGHLI